MKETTVSKQDQIVEAALRRFSHFGIAKTSFTEVAEDLGLSKQALSHYFNDKQGLVQAVIDKLTTEYGYQLRKEIQNAVSVEEALHKLIDVKGAFFEKHFMLLNQAENLTIIRDQAKDNWQEFVTVKESGLLTALLQEAAASGELKPLDAPKTAQLLMEILYAFTKCIAGKGALPQPEDFTAILQKQREVIGLFYQGLKSDTWEK